MTRADGYTSTGCIMWPTSDNPGPYKDTGEGGLGSYAYFPEEYPNDADEIFNVCCVGGGIELEARECVLNREENFAMWPDFNNKDMAYNNPEKYKSLPCLAIISLGSTGGAWFSKEEGKYWFCTRDKLTSAGLILIETLEDLYDREAHFVTLLDT